MGDIKLLEDSFFMESAEYEYTPARVIEHKGHQLHILGTVHGKMGHAGVPTGNNRRYGVPIIESNLKRLAPAIAARGLFGEADHPSDGKTKLQRISHIVTDLKLESNGIIGGSWDILDTPNGRIEQAVLKAGGRLGASTRGRGTTSVGTDGVEDVNPDYLLITVDGVVDPAAKDSYPTLVAEAQDLQQLEEMVMSYEILKRDYPGLTEELVAKVLEEHKDKIVVQVPEEFEGFEDAVSVVRKEFEEKLGKQAEDLKSLTLDALDEYRKDISTEERGKLMQTLEPVKDRVALEDISRVLVRRGILLTDEQKAQIEDMKAALKEAQESKEQAEKKLDEVHEQANVLADLGTKASMTLVAERALGGKPYRQAVLDVLGDFSKYETREDFQKALDSSIGKFDENEQETTSLKNEAQAKELEREREEHRQTLAGLERSLGDIEKAHEEEVAELKSRHEVETSELKAEVESWKERFERERKQVEDLNVTVREAITAAKEIEQEALGDEQKYEEKIRDLKDRNKVLREELDRANLKVKVERMLIGRKDADRLRPLVENVEDEDEAAKIIASAVKGSTSMAEGQKPKPKGIQSVLTDDDDSRNVAGTADFHEEMADLGIEDPSSLVEND